VLHVLAVVFGVVAVILMILALAGMVAERPSARLGWVLRVLAVVCFAAAVAFNVAAH
jgi:hypothetical protein